MENDVLKNKIAPWQEKGRWVKLTCVSDGSVWKIDPDKSDPIFPNSYVASGYYVNLASTEIEAFKYKLTDIKVKLFSPLTSGSGFELYSKYFIIYITQLRQNIVLCPVNIYTGIVEVYVFVSMDE